MTVELMMNHVEPPRLLAICHNPYCLAGIDSPRLPKKCRRCGWPIGKVPTAEDMARLARKAAR